MGEKGHIGNEDSCMVSVRETRWYKVQSINLPSSESSSEALPWPPVEQHSGQLDVPLGP